MKPKTKTFLVDLTNGLAIKERHVVSADLIELSGDKRGIGGLVAELLKTACHAQLGTDIRMTINEEWADALQAYLENQAAYAWWQVEG